MLLMLQWTRNADRQDLRSAGPLFPLSAIAGYLLQLTNISLANMLARGIGTRSPVLRRCFSSAQVRAADFTHAVSSVQLFLAAQHRGQPSSFESPN